MDPFDRPYWSRLQVELWICTRSRDAVRLAAHAPGKTHLADLSLGPDGADDERLDDDPPLFDDDVELIGMAIIKCGCVCSYDDARKQMTVASAKDELRAYRDPEVDDPHRQVFERAVVLRLWPDQPVDAVLEAVSPAPQDQVPEGANASSRKPPLPKPKAGRRAPWIKDLRKYLWLRLKRGDDLEMVSLSGLRRDFSGYATQQQIKIPKARSNLDNQIKKVLPQVIAEHQAREWRDQDRGPSIAEVTRPPGIRSK